MISKILAVGTEDGPWRTKIRRPDGTLVGTGSVFAYNVTADGNLLKWSEYFQKEAGFSYLADDRKWEVYVDPVRQPSGEEVDVFTIRSNSMHFPWYPLEAAPGNRNVANKFHQVGWYTITATQFGQPSKTGYLHVTKPAGFWREEVFEHSTDALPWPRRASHDAEGNIVVHPVRWMIEWRATAPDVTGWWIHQFETTPG